MGAKAFIWFLRIWGSIAILLGIAVVALLPVSIWLRVTVLAAGLLIGLDQAWRRIPAFDPFGRIRWRLGRHPKGRKWCAVTFDDGPSPGTARTLDILREHGVTATFFVLAKNAERYPELVRRARDEGHVIGIHGVSHAKLTGASEACVERQIQGSLECLKALGVEPAPLYRTPHGFKSRAVFRLAERFGLTIWAWSRGVWDTDLPEPAVLVRRATRLARPGMVLLLHDGHDDEAEPNVVPMIEALPSILRELKRRGFEFVGLDEA